MKKLAWLIACAAALLAAACKEPLDPCPLPPEQHPAQYRADTIWVDGLHGGQIFGIAYICVGR